MRVNVKKYFFFGARSALESFFSDAQSHGIVQFIDKEKKKLKEVPPEINRIQQAIRIVHHLPPVEQLEFDDYSEADDIAREVVGIHTAIEGLMEERREVRQEIARIEPFGSFDPEILSYIENKGKRQVQFFCAKHQAPLEITDDDDVIHVASEHGLDYFVAFNKERRSYKGMLEMIIEAPLDELRGRYDELNQQISEKEEELKTYANRDNYLHEALINRVNDNELKLAKQAVAEQGEGKAFYIEGWVPDHRLKELGKLTKEHPVFAEEIAIEEKDKIPTCLHNEGFSRIGEDLVHIYDTPSNTDRDPSLWVLMAFALFFSMILSDGGYGAIFLATALYLRFKNPKPSAGGKRVMTLVTVLALSCIGWGVLTNSFFGIKFAPDSAVMDFSLVQRAVETKATYHLDQKDAVYDVWVKDFPELASVGNYQDFLDGAVVERGGEKLFLMRDKFYDNVMMELALLIGVIHIIISFLRYVDRNWAAIGWVAALVGGYLYFAVYLKASSMVNYVLGVSPDYAGTVGFQLLTGGIGVACFLSLVQNRLGGLTEVLNVIGIFSDVLSYLRLYALGLAGSMVSSTFNGMGASVGFVGGVLVIILGHVVNIALSVMGGVIHGLRLNFLEWYHYSFEGGGQLFKPLQKQKIK